MRLDGDEAAGSLITRPLDLADTSASFPNRDRTGSAAVVDDDDDDDEDDEIAENKDAT